MKSDILNYLLKEKDAPMSAETHLFSAFMQVISEVSDDTLEVDGEGCQAIVEHMILQYGGGPAVPERYRGVVLREIEKGNLSW